MLLIRKMSWTFSHCIHNNHRTVSNTELVRDEKRVERLVHLPVFLIDWLANWLNVELNLRDRISEFLVHVPLWKSSVWRVHFPLWTRRFFSISISSMTYAGTSSVFVDEGTIDRDTEGLWSLLEQAKFWPESLLPFWGIELWFSSVFDESSEEGIDAEIVMKKKKNVCSMIELIVLDSEDDEWRTFPLFIPETIDDDSLLLLLVDEKDIRELSSPMRRKSNWTFIDRDDCQPGLGRRLCEGKDESDCLWFPLGWWWWLEYSDVNWESVRSEEESSPVCRVRTMDVTLIADAIRKQILMNKIRSNVFLNLSWCDQWWESRMY